MNKEQFEYLCDHPELFEMSYDEWLEEQPKDTNTMEIKYKEIELEVEYYIIHGDESGPYTDDTLSIEKIFCGGQDITDIVDIRSMEAIQELAAEKYFDK
jgi:hypothetical protein